MIPLSAACRLDGLWPEAVQNILFRVDGEIVDGNTRKLGLTGFHGCSPNFSAQALFGPDESVSDLPRIFMPSEMVHLEPGDLLSVNSKNGRLRVLYRNASNHNSFLVTERCDNYCLMCSQPPRRVQDDYLLAEIAACIPMMPCSVREVGFTGGEPTLSGTSFVDILRLCKQYLPQTAVHVLTNGRSFSTPEFAKEWASVEHPDLMTGIPIYSDQSTIHDFVVQSDGAFDETVRGILNLKRLAQRVEVRIVLHRHTIGRLSRFAQFIVHNFPFVDHVALMGLELMGFAKANVDDLWIDPRDHAETIAASAEILERAGLRTSIYNLPLCLLDQRARRFAVKSVSDWKREYWRQCEGCTQKSLCGGSFASSRAKLEPYIQPFR